MNLDVVSDGLMTDEMSNLEDDYMTSSIIVSHKSLLLQSSAPCTYRVDEMGMGLGAPDLTGSVRSPVSLIRH